VTEFRMPSLGADMEAGTLIEWLVKPGDWVKRGDIVAVVETQKGAIEIEIYQPGQIEKFLVHLHSKVPVGTPLALIRTEGEAKAPAAAAPPPVAPQPAAAAMPPPLPAAPTAPISPPVAARKAASPAARRLAEERGIDLSAITAAGRAVQSRLLISSTILPPPLPHLRRGTHCGSTPQQCARRSLPQWHDRNSKSHTTISSTRSTLRRASTGSPIGTPPSHRTVVC
jgi:pyruvate dehydrogenase E2 component (dihydrolipoamide acetyltransferase)